MCSFVSLIVRRLYNLPVEASGPEAKKKKIKQCDLGEGRTHDLEINSLTP